MDKVELQHSFVTQKIWVFSADVFCFFIGTCREIVRFEGHWIFFSLTRIHIGFFHFLDFAVAAVCICMGVRGLRKC